ncbi:MAG: error-prone DNA polymerase, partial [Pseudomonadota bacterium]|nr:error-prone DNA polymerase [Pseudomonadota bacterium]
HAASFAILAYISSWMKCHHPEVFCCALLNAWPMGFYQPAQIVRDAREHGVEVRPVDVNHSHWDCTLEPMAGPYKAVRLGMRLVSGLGNEAGAGIIVARGALPYESVEELWLRSGATAAALELLAEADAFGSIKLRRRDALWAVKGLANKPLPLFAAQDRVHRPLPEIVEQPVLLAAMSDGNEVVEDYRHIGLTLRQHPLFFLREELTRQKTVTAAALKSLPNGSFVTVAGLVLVRQKPGTAKGVLFMTIEDETAAANIIVWPDLFERERRVLLSAPMIGCAGQLQREGEVIHLVARRFIDYSVLLGQIGGKGLAGRPLYNELEFGARNFC